MRHINATPIFLADYIVFKYQAKSIQRFNPLQTDIQFYLREFIYVDTEVLYLL
jgi:hypothetical protein